VAGGVGHPSGVFYDLSSYPSVCLSVCPSVCFRVVVSIWRPQAGRAHHVSQSVSQVRSPTTYIHPHTHAHMHPSIHVWMGEGEGRQATASESSGSVRSPSSLSLSLLLWIEVGRLQIYTSHHINDSRRDYYFSAFQNFCCCILSVPLSRSLHYPSVSLYFSVCVLL